MTTILKYQTILILEGIFFNDDFSNAIADSDINISISIHHNLRITLFLCSKPTNVFFFLSQQKIQTTLEKVGRGHKMPPPGACHVEMHWY